jgi:hypothetical protein
MLKFLVLALLTQIPNLPALNGTVTGVLRNASGKPAAGVRVSAVVPPSSATDEFRATAMASLAETDAEGRYRLEAVPPGRYYISAGRVDFPTYYPGTSVLAEGSLVLVTTGATVSNINFVLRDESSGRAVISGLGMRTPQGFNVPVSVIVEGGGKIPVFQNGDYPVVRATHTQNKSVIEISLGDPTLFLPLPPSSTSDEYRITLNDLQGYTVKSMFYGSADVRKETLKAQRTGLATQPQYTVGNTTFAASLSGAPLTVVLARTQTAPSNGIRVSGRSVGAGDEIYISGNPGTLYSDGTFEFYDLLPGTHRIIKIFQNVVTAGAVFVGSRDVEGLALQRPTLLPIDVFEAPSKEINGTLSDSKVIGMVTLTGHVIDETSKEPLNEGTVTIKGYGSAVRNFSIFADIGFKIPDLLPGQYSMTINVTGYRATTQAVTVGPEDLKLDLVAQKAIP